LFWGWKEKDWVTLIKSLINPWVEESIEKCAIKDVKAIGVKDQKVKADR